MSSPTIYGVGTRVFLDWIESKPLGRVTDITPSPEEPANPLRARVTVRLDKPFGGCEWAYVSPYIAVPKKQILPRKRGQFYTRINTHYIYAK